MVLSKINSSVSYPELKKANPEDADMEADMYAISVKGLDIVVVLGNSRDDFKKQDLIYFPIYMAKTNGKVVQVGVYEVPYSKLGGYLDKDGDLDLEKVGSPLIYSFATKSYIEKRRTLPPKEDVAEGNNGEDNVEGGREEEKEEEEEEEEEEEDEMGLENTRSSQVKKKRTNASVNSDHTNGIPDTRSDIFILTKGVQIPAPLEEESKTDAKEVREKYNEKPDHNWVQKILKNPHYDLVDNEGGGDCLFATIRDAFSQIAQQTSVAKIRKKLAEEATSEVFTTYRELYDMYHNALINDTSRIKQLAKSYVDIKDKFSNVLDRNEQKILVENAKQVKEQHDKFIGEKKVTAEIINEFKFMKDIDTLEKFKKKIQTCEFWGETWSISTLERALNIKFILLSNEAYAAKDYDNILHCGQLNDSILQNKGYFNPDYYLIVEYTGSHYRLVSYRDKQIFTFPEIPYDLKKLVVDKCMERNAGPFSLIKDFTSLKKKKDSKAELEEFAIEADDLTEAKLRGVYNDDVVFSFYSKSAAKPLPGKGNGEKIPKDLVKEFAALATIPDWRKRLANTWIQPFTLDNHQWSSVEHYYQASKFKKDNPEFYLSFSLDSGTDLSRSVEMAVAAGGKTGKYKGELLRPKQVLLDPEFFGERSAREINDAQTAKFTQNPDLQKILLLTKTAKLVEHKRGKEPETYEALMMLRDDLTKEDR